MKWLFTISESTFKIYYDTEFRPHILAQKINCNDNYFNNKDTD
jgi:hypothetical protein